MEVAGMFSSPAIRLSGAGVNNGSLRLPFRHMGMVNSRVSFKARDYTGILSRGFPDSGHLQYYASTSMGEGKKQKEKSREIKTEKKQLKLIKRLSKDLDFFGHTVDVEESVMDEVKGKMVSEATEVLLAELRRLRSEQKEQKRKRKEEKAQRKATLVKAKAKIDTSGSLSSSSSSSSESSDSDCGAVMNMSSLRGNALKQCMDRETEQEQDNNEEQAADISLPKHEEQNNSSPQNVGEDCSNDHERSGIASGSRIEICMGGKCKKMGAVALLEEFERKVGGEGTVVGCKCMGKCKNGPNVKVQNESAKGCEEPLINPLSLFIGVGLQDVDTIVRNLRGKDRNNNGLMAPA